MFTDSRTARLFRAFTLASMMTCLAFAFLLLIRLFAPAYAPWWFLPGAFLICLEAQASYILGEQLSLRGRDWATYRLVELAMIALLLRLLTLTGQGFSELLTTLQGWVTDPMALFDLEYTTLLIVLLLFWVSAHDQAADLAALEWRPTDFDQRGQPLVGEWSRTDRATASEGLAHRFFIGGALLLAMVGIPHLIATSQATPPTSTPLIITTLGYFGLGLVLLSQAHLSNLRLTWLTGDFKLDPTLGQQWRALSLIFIVGVALLVSLLPTAYTGSLLEAINALIVLLSIVSSLLAAFLVLPFAFLFWLFVGQFEGAPMPTLPALPDQPPPLDPVAGPGWWAALRLILFWLVLLLGIGYILRDYLKTHGIWLQQLKTLPLIGPLLAWLASLLGLARRTSALLVAQWRPSSAKASQTGQRWAERWPRLRLHRLSPTDQVRYFYLSHLRRAAQKGHPRPPAQTPTNYAQTLRPHLGDQGQAWQELTEVFQQARYGPTPISPEDAAQARTIWQRLKQALRALR